LSSRGGRKGEWKGKQIKIEKEPSVSFLYVWQGRRRRTAVHTSEYWRKGKGKEEKLKRGKRKDLLRLVDGRCEEEEREERRNTTLYRGT